MASIVVKVNLIDMVDPEQDRAPVFGEGSLPNLSLEENSTLGLHVGAPVSTKLDKIKDLHSMDTIAT